MVGDSTGASAGGASTESTARAARGMAGSASTMAAASPAASKAPRAGCNDTFFNCTWKLSEVQTVASNRARPSSTDRRRRSTIFYRLPPGITVSFVSATASELLLRFTVARMSNSPSGKSRMKKNQLFGAADPSSGWVLLR